VDSFLPQGEQCPPNRVKSNPERVGGVFLKGGNRVVGISVGWVEGGGKEEDHDAEEAEDCAGAEGSSLRRRALHLGGYSRIASLTPKGT